MFSQKQTEIRNAMKREGINNNTIDFFIAMTEIFEATDQLESTSKKLAYKIGRSERSVQRYVKTLQEKNYLHVKPIWNNTNPEKPYITKNIYSLTYKSSKLMQKMKYGKSIDEIVQGPS